MGGIGSGRHWRFDAKDTVEDFRSIDVRRWQRDGLLNPGQWFGWNWSRDGETVASIRVEVEAGSVVLKYRHRRNGEEWQGVEYPVRIAQTSCRYGGTRSWFICPAAGCGRRVAILYMGGRHFACRHCYRLAYESQREVDYDRKLRKAQKIRRKLGGSESTFDPFPEKPKGMHWRTYERLSAEAEDSERQSWLGIADKLNLR